MSAPAEPPGEEEAESPVVGRQEQKDARRRASPSAAVVYEAILTEGNDELGRSTVALAGPGSPPGWHKLQHSVSGLVARVPSPLHLRTRG